jgi:hypothetical protein
VQTIRACSTDIRHTYACSRTHELPGTSFGCHVLSNRCWGVGVLVDYCLLCRILHEAHNVASLVLRSKTAAEDKCENRSLSVAQMYML